MEKKSIKCIERERNFGFNKITKNPSSSKANSLINKDLNESIKIQTLGIGDRWYGNKIFNH